MSGITSYRGFLYQQEIFYDRLLNNLFNGDFEIGFEIADDVNIEYKLATLKYRDNLIQVKSGNLTKEDLFKIFDNWILETDFSRYQDFNYELISEKKVNLKTDDQFLEDLKSHIINSKDNDKRSIKRQTYDKIIGLGYDEKQLVDYLKHVRDTYIITDCYDIKDVKKNQFDLFDDKCCNDIDNNLSVPKKERFKYIKQKIFEELVNKVETGSGYIIASGRFIKYWGESCQKFGNEKFEPDFIEFKNNKNVEFNINEILNDNKLEVKQLKLAERTEQQIYEDILKELFYRKLIDYYKELDNNKVLMTHEEAKDNYVSAIDELELNERDKTPKNIYIVTTNKEIKSEIISTSGSSKFLQKGCYIHMTSEEVDESLRIRWGDLND